MDLGINDITSISAPFHPERIFHENNFCVAITVITVGMRARV